MRSCSNTADRITELIKDKKVDHKDGTLLYHVGNFTNDLTKFEQITTFKDLFQFYEHENYPIRYCSVSNPEDAYFKIYFVAEDGNVYDDKKNILFKCPLEFEPDVLATTYGPYGGKWQGFMFINDKWYWALKGNDEKKKEILPTLIHEAGHWFNLNHNSNPKSIMAAYDGPDQVWMDDDAQLLFKIYKDDRLNAVKNSRSAMLFVNYARSANGVQSANRTTHELYGKSEVMFWIKISAAAIVCLYILHLLVKYLV